MPLTLLRPMDAVVVLYAEGAHEMSKALIASLSRAIFGTGHVASAGKLQGLIARISYRVSGNSNPLTTTSK